MSSVGYLVVEAAPELSVHHQVSMNLLPFGDLKQPCENSKDVLTPRSQSCSTCDGSDNDGTGAKAAPQSSIGSFSSKSQSYSGDQQKCCTGQLSPRSQLSVGQSEDIKTFVGGANTGDGFDDRWLAQTGCEDRCAESFSGDGSLANVGRNVDGEFRCALCSQQFAGETALNCHMKFTHQEDEPVGEWLPFPSA